MAEWPMMRCFLEDRQYINQTKGKKKIQERLHEIIQYYKATVSE